MVRGQYRPRVKSVGGECSHHCASPDPLLSLVTKKKVIGLIIDQKPTWVANVLETKKSLAKKVDLLKRPHFHKEHVEF